MSDYPMSQLREMSVEALGSLLGEKREDLRALKFKAAQNELKTVHKVQETKKLIARILTAHTEKIKAN